MRRPPATRSLDVPESHRLLAYVADLELEVDRLRKRGEFVRQEVGDGLKRLSELCTDPAAGPGPWPKAAEVVRGLTAVLRDLHDPPGYHPSHDQVVAIAVRPLAEQVFRQQQRLTRNPEVALRLELETGHVEWFPARLRHILDNLFSNAIRNRDPVKSEPWVLLGLRASDAGYEFRVSDNGVGMPGQDSRGFGLVSRTASLREAGLGVGLPVVQLLVEESGGTLMVRSEGGRGTEFVLTLPRYDVDDYLT